METLVFIGGFFYRFIAWGERPPTKMIIKKGLKLLFRKSQQKQCRGFSDLPFYLESGNLPMVDSMY